MSIESSDFPNRLRAHVELQGAVLTAAELSHVGECYPRCRGKDHWDVREYASGPGSGAGESRVVRGTSTGGARRSPGAEDARAGPASQNDAAAQDGRAAGAEQITR